MRVLEFLERFIKQERKREIKRSTFFSQERLQSMHRVLKKLFTHSTTLSLSLSLSLPPSP